MYLKTQTTIFKIALTALSLISFVIAGCGGFESTDGGGNTAQGRPGNISPVVSVGMDLIIQLPSSSALILGSATDSDGTITRWQWSFVSGPSTPTMSARNEQNLSISGLVTGVYIFNLRAFDNDGASGMDSISVFVNSAANVSPTANAGADQSITLPINQVTLAGAATDTDGTILGVLWTQTSGPAGASILAADRLSTNVTFSNSGTYIFRLQVTDNNGGTATDNVQVVVNPALPSNVPPVVNAGADLTITLPTNSTTLRGTATDSDGSIAAYSWRQVSGPSAATLSGVTTANLAASGLVVGEYVFELTVTDNSGASTSDRASVFVNPAANVSPVANAGADQTITLPTNRVVLAGVATDSDGNITSVQWSQSSGPAGATFSASTNLNSNFTVTNAGTYVLQLRVTDNSGAIATDTVQVVVRPQPLVTFAVATGTTPEAYQGAYSVQVNATNLVAGQTYTVAYAFVNGTATNGSDYTGAAGTLTFTTATPSRNVQTAIRNDAAIEGNETFTIRLSDPTNGMAISGTGVHTVTITDNDAGTPPPKCDSEVTLTWIAPTQNTDGSTLTNLAGFRIYYGGQSRTYGNIIDIVGPGLTSRVVSGLAPNNYFFAMTAYNTEGDESDYSNEGRIELQQCETLAIDMTRGKLIRTNKLTGETTEEDLFQHNSALAIEKGIEE